MNVLLIDTDSTIPNLALMKISSYHKARGDKVGFNTEGPDRIYISCIFKRNRQRVQSAINLLNLQYPEAVIEGGGVGLDLNKELPPEVEQCRPDYDLYPDCDYALGFTTRGCIRDCPFCIVRRKEGYLHRVRDISEIYEPRFSQIKLLDNNILADRENFERVAEFVISHNLKIDLSQGLDIRLVDDGIAQTLSKMKPMTEWTFAFDSPRYQKAVLDGIECLKRNGINIRNKVQFYVYCDRSDGEYGIESAIERCNLLKEHGTNAYVMLNIDEEPTQRMKDLKRWANRKMLYWSHDFSVYKQKVRL